MMGHIELGEQKYHAWTFNVRACHTLHFGVYATDDVDVYVMGATDLPRWKAGERVPYRFHKRGYIITDWIVSHVGERWCLVVYNPRNNIVEGDMTAGVGP